MTRTGPIENVLDLRAVTKSNGRASSIDGQLAREVAGDLALIIEQKFLELADVLKLSAVRQFARCIHSQSEMENKFLAALGDARFRFALAHGAIAFPPAAQDIEAFERKTGRIHFRMAHGAGLLGAVFFELLADSNR